MVFEVKTGFYVIILLLDHHNNVLIVFFDKSVQLNMNGRMREQECIRCLISKMHMRSPMICCPHSATKGSKTYASYKLNSPLRLRHSPE